MSLFKKKVKKEAATVPAVEPKSFVIIKNAPEKVDYMNDFASLPKSYGTKKYFELPTTPSRPTASPRR